MQKIRSLILLIVVISVSSFKVAPEKAVDPSSDKIASINNAINAATIDGKVTSKELFNIATLVKGEKLTLKEKVALKVFGKKIGSTLTEGASTEGSEGKSQLIALLICAFVGGLGIHRFYLGYTWQGIVQLLTLGGCGIWSLIDFIRILTGSLKPKDGEYEKTL